MSHALTYALLLSIAFTTYAAPVRSAMVERSADARDVQVLLQARSASVDRNGTWWIYHGLTGLPHDPMAAGVTAIRPDGTTRTYLATDILPRNTVAPGKVGLVYGITPLTNPGMFAATAGWFDADGRPKTAVVFFREAADGTLSNYSVVPAPGARAIVAGPQNNAVVASYDPLHDGDTSLITVVNANGDVLASWGGFDAASPAEANERIANVRLYQIDRNIVGIYDAATLRVSAISIFAPEKCAVIETSPSDKPRAMTVAAYRSRFSVSDLWTVSVRDTSDSGATEVLPGTGFAATKDGVVTVVRPIVVADQPRMLVTRYTSKGRQASWSSEHFWRTVLVRNEEIRGVVAGPGTWEERVTLSE